MSQRINGIDLNLITETCNAAALAGVNCLRKWKDRFSAREKAPHDLVTEADLESQNVIFNTIKQQFPNHDFIGEEVSDKNIQVDHLMDSDHCWIVDPLDGTLNYVYQMPSWSVSVAYVQNGNVIAGSVIDAVSNDLFEARLGLGAKLNGKPIQSKNCTKLESALMIISLPTRLERNGLLARKAMELIYRSRSIRRLGSAALNCCYVAAGKADGYWAETIHAWDIAAGVLIASETGAIVSDIEGGKVFLPEPKVLICGTPELSDAVRIAFKEATD
jgi:myo-inositol-1(or 4)-monophosphatase